jgi:hypothetical protein
MCICEFEGSILVPKNIKRSYYTMIKILYKYDAKWKNNRNVFVANAKTLLVFSQTVYLGKVHLAEKEIESYD